MDADPDYESGYRRPLILDTVPDPKHLNHVLRITRLSDSAVLPCAYPGPPNWPSTPQP